MTHPYLGAVKVQIFNFYKLHMFFLRNDFGVNYAAAI